VGAEDVHPAVVTGHRLGILRLAEIVLQRCVQTFDPPTLADGRAALVSDDGHAVLDPALVEHRPESELPPVRLQERVILHREQARSLVRLQVEVELVELVATRTVRHALPPSPSASPNTTITQVLCGMAEGAEL
jgi:hypothetical protein